ncbi:hypothetical protein ABE65_002925 [Fictibacillus phosphorivorans]|uniref:Uncharacterized protein n=1 Tax=Fictibacillus phosphorivorans TaxID=1221500 RepID=A0A160IKB2_9BACL|nr:hypothetical protein [Fictibacillus phosphorivorans]ANC75840.1 hypothetical protein ABE65_002925 [Fictibacillus phosphorivorans]
MNLFETINKYKKFFEAVNLFNFIVNVKSTLFKVAYYKLGFIKGYLVLYENGTVCPRDKAIEPFKMVIQLNSYMHGFYTHGLAKTVKRETAKKGIYLK